MANKKIFGIFFSTYFWMGIVWLLFAIILNKYFGQTEYVIYIIIKLVETISIAIIVSSIFSYTLGTSEFIKKITDLLEGIVVSRRFLENLSVEGKEEALQSLLKPSEIERGTYINIERYYDDYIQDALNIRSKNVRSNYTISGVAFYDKDKKRVGVRTLYAYRLYPSENGYKDIKLGFDEEDTESVCEKVVVNRPNGEREVHTDIEMKEELNAGATDRIARIKINKHASDCSHLDIEIHVVEYGYDHWFMFTFKALQPTDGFRLEIKCRDGLEIRKNAVFDVGKSYHVDLRDRTELSINCHQWINEGVGVSVLISYPHEFSEKAYINNKT